MWQLCLPWGGHGRQEGVAWGFRRPSSNCRLLLSIHPLLAPFQPFCRPDSHQQIGKKRSPLASNHSHAGPVWQGHITFFWYFRLQLPFFLHRLLHLSLQALQVPLMPGVTLSRSHPAGCPADCFCQPFQPPAKFPSAPDLHPTAPKSIIAEEP